MEKNDRTVNNPENIKEVAKLKAYADGKEIGDSVNEETTGGRGDDDAD